ASWYEDWRATVATRGLLPLTRMCAPGESRCSWVECQGEQPADRGGSAGGWAHLIALPVATRLTPPGPPRPRRGAAANDRAATPATPRLGPRPSGRGTASSTRYSQYPGKPSTWVDTVNDLSTTRGTDPRRLLAPGSNQV